MAPVIGEDLSFNGNCIIFDLLEVSSSTHLPDGIWCVAGWTKTSTTPRLFLLQLEERADASAPGFCVGFFDVKAAFDLGEFSFTAPNESVNNIYSIIHQDVD